MKTEAQKRESIFLAHDQKIKWFDLDERYENLTVGFKSGIPSSIITTFWTDSKESQKINAMKDGNKKEERRIEQNMKMLGTAKKILRSLICKCDNKRLITDEILDEKLSIEAIMEHTSSIMQLMGKGAKENSKN